MWENAVSHITGSRCPNQCLQISRCWCFVCKTLQQSFSAFLTIPRTLVAALLSGATIFALILGRSHIIQESQACVCRICVPSCLFTLVSVGFAWDVFFFSAHARKHAINKVFRAVYFCSSSLCVSTLALNHWKCLFFPTPSSWAICITVIFSASCP